MSDETVTRNVTESADKIRVETKVKRGSGTRDQDELKVKVKGDTPAEVVAKLNETVSRLQETADSVRALQPEPEEAADPKEVAQ